MKFMCGLCSLQIFNAIPLRFSRLLRNSPRPWVRHTHSPATPDSLEKTHQKAKSSMSLQPHQKHFTFYNSHFTVFPYYHFSFFLFFMTFLHSGSEIFY